MSPIEKAARALCAVEWGAGNKFPELTDADREYWMKSARACIAAIREPDEAVLDRIGANRSPARAAVVSAIRAYFDAILKEGE